MNPNPEVDLYNALLKYETLVSLLNTVGGQRPMSEWDDLYEQARSEAIASFKTENEEKDFPPSSRPEDDAD